jgi:glycosyltransferase involved in cell wall biosynthesis
MKIGFDARCLDEENISGVGEYAFEILKNILKIDPGNKITVFSNSFKGVGNKRLAKLQKFPGADIRNFFFPNKILNFLFWYFRWPKIDSLVGGVDAFFAPNINFISTGKACPLIATFHDLSFERYPHFFAQKSRIWHKYFVCPKKIALESQKVIAVSNSTKNDLVQIYGIPSEKIDVIHHGISLNFKPIENNDPKLELIRKKYRLPDKFILYLGNIEPRKNVLSAIKAFERLIASETQLVGYKLVLAGNISPFFRNLLKSSKILICGYIERKDRPYFYNLATLSVYPSFFEGFGLPILESMASGTPVIASHNSSLPEIAGSAAVLVDPNRPIEISEAMRSLLLDNKLYDNLRKRGLEQANKFSWEKSAKKTLSVIASVAKQSRAI